MQGDAETRNKWPPRTAVLKDDRGNPHFQASPGGCWVPMARGTLTMKGKWEGNLCREAKASNRGACEFVLEMLSSLQGVKEKAKQNPRESYSLP